MSALVSRRSFAIGSAASLAVSSFVSRKTFAATPVAGDSTAASPIVPGDGRFLLVADPAAADIAMYALPSLNLTGNLPGVALDKHAGVVALADGRVIFGDDATQEIVAITIDANGLPTIAQRVAASFGDGLAWAAMDAKARYYVVTSGVEGTLTRFLNVVDLATFTNTSVEIEAAEDEELEAWITGEPAYAFLSVGGRVDAYLLDDLIAGEAAPTSSLAIEFGSHGPVADAANGRLLISTAAGFEVIDADADPIVAESLIPWEVDGFTGGQNFRPRLGWDGATIFGVLTPTPENPETWADVEVSAHITNLADLSATRVSLGHGLWAGRWGLGAPFALFAGHDGVTGTAALFDVDPASATFGTVVSSTAIDKPTLAAIPGTAADGAEGYLTAITHDGALGFVVLGGDGRILVIDTEQAAVAATIATANPLTGAGYITVIESGVAPVDLVAR
ncbi:hypothetical protein BH09CHL1_BH09CHL1_09780 [soil metagenome]